MIKWTTISLYDMDSGRELEGAERIRKLREYRDTAAMAGVVLVDPTEAASPQDFDELCEAGPAASEIDWTGLDLVGKSATEEQLQAIRRRAYDAEARLLQTFGATMSIDQAEELGEEALDWLQRRLKLHLAFTHEGLVALPSSAHE